jgi:hypothetical protein
MVRFNGISGYSRRSFSRVITEEGVVNTLNEEGIKLGYLLSTNPKSKFCGVRSVIRVQPSSVIGYSGDTGVFDPNVAHEVTLGADRNDNFIIGTECTNEV